ncbi:hypothetical protein GCM10023322_26750 [Rugosimonospora acidiphila]|uniref:Peptidase M23 n=1 Tax=Rugosimonospora acidiphila TaxID=556531 RepID=A0ABP9RSM1_9ACTN
MGRPGHHPRHAAASRRYRVAMASAACAVAAGAVGGFAYDLDHPGRPAGPSTLAASGPRRVAGNDVSRDLARGAPPPSLPAGLASPSPQVPDVQRRHAPVPGLSQAQTDNAAIILWVAQRRVLPRRAMVVAIVTALQESSLYNRANRRVPASLNLAHQGTGSDHDSVGLFQQRPSQGWGTVAQLMDPPTASGLFFDRLVRVPGWQSISVAAAAQAVQRSAYPSAYRRHEDLAERVVGALS